MNTAVIVVVMLASAVAAVAFAGISGQSWPLPFAGTMVAGSLIIGVAELLSKGGRR